MKAGKFILRVLLCVTLILPFSCRAGGIMGDLTSLFMSNSTASGVLNTPTRTGVFGGSFVARAPVTSINWVSFDPPRFDAGCGGVDLYGGSFTFINSQQLVQIFRNVAANAAGLAFRAAIKAIAPSLDQLISDFQSLMQSLNNLAKNSCAMAHMIVDPAEKAVNTALNGEGSNGAVQKGMFDDQIASLDKWVVDKTNTLNDIAKNNSKSGNGIVKALVNSKAGDIMGLSTVPNIDGSTEDASLPNSLNNRILISLIGYEIAAIPCQKSAETGSANTTIADPKAVGIISCKGEPTIDLEDLIKGGGTGSSSPDVPLKLYFCLNPSGTASLTATDTQPCTKMQRKDYNYVGIRGWVNNTLFGNPIGDTTAITAGSIVGAFNAGGSAALTSAQIKFIQTARIPLTGLFARTTSPEHRTAIAEKLSDHIVDCMASRIGESIYKSANYLKGSTGNYHFNPEMMARIERLKDDAETKRVTCNKDLTVLHLVEEANAATKFFASSNR